MRIATVFVLAATVAGGCVSSSPEGRATPVSILDAGQVLPDLALQGFRSAADTDGLQTVSTWEYHDPDGHSYDLLHVMVICMWCPHCAAETSEVVKIASWQADHRVAVIQIALQGYVRGEPPTWDEVQKWALGYGVGFPVLIDGQAAQLGQYFDASSVPLNIVVNPRDMGVLAIDVGEVGDGQKYEQGFLGRP